MNKTSPIQPASSQQPGRRRFTLEEANRSLPLVSRITQDIVTLYRQMVAAQQKLTLHELPMHEREQLEQLAERQETQFELYLNELDEVGCELKDANVGLLDFVGRHDNRDVYLCWRLGESQVAFWHEIQAGFGGRRSISSLKPTA